jgi:hypothetical protein
MRGQGKKKERSSELGQTERKRDASQNLQRKRRGRPTDAKLARLAGGAAGNISTSFGSLVARLTPTVAPTFESRLRTASRLIESARLAVSPINTAIHCACLLSLSQPDRCKSDITLPPIRTLTCLHSHWTSIPDLFVPRYRGGSRVEFSLFPRYLRPQ